MLVPSQPVLQQLPNLDTSSSAFRHPHITDVKRKDELISVPENCFVERVSKGWTSAIIAPVAPGQITPGSIPHSSKYSGAKFNIGRVILNRMKPFHRGNCALQLLFVDYMRACVRVCERERERERGRERKQKKDQIL